MLQRFVSRLGCERCHCGYRLLRAPCRAFEMARRLIHYGVCHLAAPNKAKQNQEPIGEAMKDLDHPLARRTVIKGAGLGLGAGMLAGLDTVSAQSPTAAPSESAEI